MTFSFPWLRRSADREQIKSTLCEAKRAAWTRVEGDGLPDPPRITAPGPDAKQHRTVQRMKRKAS